METLINVISEFGVINLSPHLKFLIPLTEWTPRSTPFIYREYCLLYHVNNPELDRYFSIVRINYLPVDEHLSVIRSGGWRGKLYLPQKVPIKSHHIDSLQCFLKVLNLMSKLYKMFIWKFRSLLTSLRTIVNNSLRYASEVEN